MTCFARIEGALVESVGPVWAAFSPVTGETSLLNDECAAILEILDLGPALSDEVCDMLASDSGMTAGSLASLVEQSWPHMIESGLVYEIRQSPAVAG